MIHIHSIQSIGFFYNDCRGISAISGDSLELQLEIQVTHKPKQSDQALD